MSSPFTSPITCHVLNTLTGTPAANLTCKLTLLSPLPSNRNSQRRSFTQILLPAEFSARTDADGRVRGWDPTQSHNLTETLAEFKDGERIAWSIKFEVGEWYGKQGVESFWPEIEVKFFVRKGERHYHVPVLVGPWTYTTYRGS